MEKRTIPEYENYYVCENGDVWHKYKLFKLKQRTLKAGYVKVSLRKASGEQKSLSVHVLVALCFIGPRPGKLHINHKDGDKQNNNVSNLEYITASENYKHAFRLGLRTQKGELNSCSKLSEDQVRQIKYDQADCTLASLGRQYSVSGSTIRQIRERIKWKHV